MTRTEYAKKLIDEILIDLSDTDAQNVVKILAQEYELIDNENEVF